MFWTVATIVLVGSFATGGVLPVVLALAAMTVLFPLTRGKRLQSMTVAVKTP